MRLKLLLIFLPLLIHAYPEDQGPVSYSHNLNIWNHAITHPAHQVPRPIPRPSIIKTLAIPTDAPGTTAVFVQSTLNPFIPPRPTLRPWNPNIEGTTSRVDDTKIEEHPTTLRPGQNRPSYVRPPLQPRPVPNPSPLPVPSNSATTASIIEPTLEPEQSTTQRLVTNWPNSRLPFQFRPQPNIPVVTNSIPEITTSSLIIEPATTISPNAPLATEPPVPIITSTIAPDVIENQEGNVLPDKNIIDLPTELSEPNSATYAPFPASTGRIPFYPQPYPTRFPLRPEPNWQITSTSVQPPIRQPLVPEPIPTYRPPVTQKSVTLPPPIIANDEEMISGYSCAQANGYFGYLNDCNFFVECRNNIGIMYMCTDDLYFNPKAIWPENPCALPSEVQCDNNAKTSEPIITSTIAPENPDGSKAVVIPDNNIVELPTILPEPISTTYAPFVTSTGHVPLYPRPNLTRLPLRPKQNFAILTTVRPPIRQPLIPDPIHTNRPLVSQRPVTLSPNSNENGQPLPPIITPVQLYPRPPPQPFRPATTISPNLPPATEPPVPIISSTIAPDVIENQEGNVLPDNNIIDLPTELPETNPATYGDVPLYPRPNPTRLPLRPEPNWAVSTTVRPPIRQPLIPDPMHTNRPPVSQTPVTLSPNSNGNGQPLPPIISNDGEMLSGYICPRADGYFGYPNECDSFVECQKNVAFRYICPDGLHFNPNTIWPEYPCAYPSEVKCTNNSVKQVPQPTADCPHRHGYFPMNDGECGRYIMCQEGLATIMNCPQGLVFNPEMSSCDWPENVPSCNPDVFRGFTCPAPTLDDNGNLSEEILKFRYGQHCNEYIACYRGHPRLLSCDPGFSFDKDVQACVASDYVQDCRA